MTPFESACGDNLFKQAPTNVEVYLVLIKQSDLSKLL